MALRCCQPRPLQQGIGASRRERRACTAGRGVFCQSWELVLVAGQRFRQPPCCLNQCLRFDWVCRPHCGFCCDAGSPVGQGEGGHAVDFVNRHIAARGRPAGNSPLRLFSDKKTHVLAPEKNPAELSHGYFFCFFLLVGAARADLGGYGLAGRWRLGCARLWTLG